MKYPRAQIAKAMIEYFGSDIRRIEHALRVLHHADRLMADYSPCDPDIVVATALLHDVGIKPAEAMHGSSNAQYQEKYGPAAAEELLRKTDFPPEKIEMVKNIIGNHHSPSRYDYKELELLKAADLVVNRAEKV
ncbi:MAG: phosphohydrolase [Verrucomicrobia bacterium]|nr:phosphohydrolase [Verrucomicrobiota bacterium]